VERPWTTPVAPLEFDDCFKYRVEELVATNKKINILWSGGIDSTAAVVGFLKHCQNLDQIRIFYSTFSVKENPYFYLLLNEYPIEMVEFSGDVYLTQTFDGIFIDGNPADDLFASLDKSFFENVGLDTLNLPWKDYFFKTTKDTEFVNYCEKFFNLTDNINTLLDARWWFYTTCKIHKWTARSSNILQETQPLPLGFFDSYQFEHYMFNNLDKIINTLNYVSYKQLLKDYIFEFDKNKHYHKNKEKVNSYQMQYYWMKKIHLQDIRYIMLLSDGTRIRTENLPFLSEKEYRTTFGNSLDYLFN
jgi:hypothetical protein